MATQWYYGRDGQQQGPVSSEQLKELAASGKLLPTDLVWKEGMSDWAAASKIKGLFPDRISSEPAVDVSAIGEQAAGSIAGAASGAKKVFGWLNDTVGLGNLEKKQRLFWLGGSWKSNDGSPTLTFTPESQALQSNRYTLIVEDGVATTCEFDPKGMTVTIQSDQGSSTLKIMTLTQSQLVISSDTRTVQYKKSGSSLKDAVDPLKKAAGWYNDNLGFGMLKNQQRITQLSGSWESTDDQLPSVLITADDANTIFSGGEHAVGVHRTDGFTGKGVFKHREMTLILTPDGSQESIAVKVVSLNQQELVVSWHDGVAYYRRVAALKRKRQTGGATESQASGVDRTVTAANVYFGEMQIQFQCGDCGAQATVAPDVTEMAEPAAVCEKCKAENRLPSSIEDQGRVFCYCHTCDRLVYVTPDYTGLEINCPYPECGSKVLIPGEKKAISPGMKTAGKIALGIVGAVAGAAASAGGGQGGGPSPLKTRCPRCKQWVSNVMYQMDRGGSCPHCGYPH